MDKTGRNGLRVDDLFDKSFTTQYIKLRIKHQKLLENFSFERNSFGVLHKYFLEEKVI